MPAHSEECRQRIGEALLNEGSRRLDTYLQKLQKWADKQQATCWQAQSNVTPQRSSLQARQLPASLLRPFLAAVMQKKNIVVEGARFRAKCDSIQKILIRTSRGEVKTFEIVRPEDVARWLQEGPFPVSVSVWKPWDSQALERAWGPLNRLKSSLKYMRPRLHWFWIHAVADGLNRINTGESL